MAVHSTQTAEGVKPILTEKMKTLTAHLSLSRAHSLFTVFFFPSILKVILVHDLKKKKANNNPHQKTESLREDTVENEPLCCWNFL